MITSWWVWGLSFFDKTSYWLVLRSVYHCLLLQVGALHIKEVPIFHWSIGLRASLRDQKVIFSLMHSFKRARKTRALDSSRLLLLQHVRHSSRQLLHHLSQFIVFKNDSVQIGGPFLADNAKLMNSVIYRVWWMIDCLLVLVMRFCKPTLMSRY